MHICTCDFDYIYFLSFLSMRIRRPFWRNVWCETICGRQRQVLDCDEIIGCGWWHSMSCFKADDSSQSRCTHRVSGAGGSSGCSFNCFLPTGWQLWHTVPDLVHWNEDHGYLSECQLYHVCNSCALGVCWEREREKKVGRKKRIQYSYINTCQPV